MVETTVAGGARQRVDVHIIDDPCLSPRVKALLTRARRGPAMSADQFRESARAEAPDGGEVPLPDAAVEAMVRFEERYGGLWYPLIGSNGMEHGLDGEVTVHPSIDGWSFSGILDGDQTWTVEVLLDERTAMTLADRPRIINRSIMQRLESHAQLAQVRGWPHVTLGISTEPGQEPTVCGADLPALDVVATGPADKWWSNGQAAVHAGLHKWWGGEDVWIVRCFARQAEDLAATVESVRHAMTGSAWVNEDWCALCTHFRHPEQPASRRHRSSNL
ncbi:hypothetical protein [Streptomyces sp. NBC_01092]|uniref:hypothetical protein n=1 Tax=Streptomyces sp. NBC_01092 TaxID=2903748 RepID=UPI003863FB25|nr:hypothetical protein OG254_38455 [Streptomyces sp. NBC_01092]